MLNPPYRVEAEYYCAIVWVVNGEKAYWKEFFLLDSLKGVVSRQAGKPGDRLGTVYWVAAGQA